MLKKVKPIVEVLEDVKAIFRIAVRLKKDMTALKNKIKRTSIEGVRMRRFDLSDIWTYKLIYFFVRQEKPLGEFLLEALKDGQPSEKHRTLLIKT